jgi:hypothetical protein
MERSQNNSHAPRTIKELKDWYEARNLPPYETTRFFIGINYKHPKAFGIYQDEYGDFVVYKNKDTGERAIRYQGPDEAYAVNELYLRLKEEIVNQRSHQTTRSSSSFSLKEFLDPTPPAHLRKKTVGNRIISAFCYTALAVLVGGLIFKAIKPEVREGYYRYDDTSYYADYHSYWYEYDEDNYYWKRVSSDDEDIQYLTKNYKDYYITENWDPEAGYPNVIKSDAYQDTQEAYRSAHENDSDDDSYYDWGDNDTWSDTNTDWGSDW